MKGVLGSIKRASKGYPSQRPPGGAYLRGHPGLRVPDPKGARRALTSRGAQPEGH